MPALSLARAGPPSVSESLPVSTDRIVLGRPGRFRSGQVIDDQPNWSVRAEKRYGIAMSLSRKQCSKEPGFMVLVSWCWFTRAGSI